MAGPQQDPWHSHPSDGQAEPAYPQDEADQAQERKKRDWVWKVADVALDIVGGVIEGILDNL